MSDLVLKVYYKRHLTTLAQLERRIMLVQRLVAESEAEAAKRGIDLNG